MWNLKYDMYGLTYKTGSQRTDLWLTNGRDSGVGIEWEVGVSRCRLVYIERVNNKIPLYSIRN